MFVRGEIGELEVVNTVLIRVVLLISIHLLQYLEVILFLHFQTLQMQLLLDSLHIDISVHLELL
jgi:hypothetical protein